MLKTIASTLLAMTALGLATSASAAPKAGVKERGHLTITAALAPPATAPVGPSGTAEIAVEKAKYKSAETATLAITVTGLPSGTYSVDANLKDASVVHLGDLVVDATVPAPATPTPVVLPLPAGFDVSTVATITVSDATPIVVLEGAVVPGDVTWKFIANVPVTAPEVLVAGDSKPKKVRGHVVAHSFITDNVENQRKFHWVASGAPGDSELTINVDGVAVGTVMSTAQGKVMFEGMPEPVVIRDMKLVTITDATGAIVMQAQF